jgi:hypothetical protein
MMATPAYRCTNRLAVNYLSIYRCRDALQPVGKRYRYLQKLLVTREHPGEDPQWENNTE